MAPTNNNTAAAMINSSLFDFFTRIVIGAGRSVVLSFGFMPI